MLFIFDITHVRYYQKCEILEDWSVHMYVHKSIKHRVYASIIELVNTLLKMIIIKDFLFEQENYILWKGWEWIILPNEWRTRRLHQQMITNHILWEGHSTLFVEMLNDITDWTPC